MRVWRYLLAILQPEESKVYVIALATDYDGTLAEDGNVSAATIESLERFKDSGRRLIMVTGRELPELTARSVIEQDYVHLLRRPIHLQGRQHGVADYIERFMQGRNQHIDGWPVIGIRGHQHGRTFEWRDALKETQNQDEEGVELCRQQGQHQHHGKEPYVAPGGVEIPPHSRRTPICVARRGTKTEQDQQDGDRLPPFLAVDEECGHHHQHAKSSLLLPRHGDERNQRQHGNNQREK